MVEAPRPRDTRTRDRALFLTVALFAVLGAYAGHQYFASDAGRARTIVTEARSRPASRAMLELGCDDPKVFTPAEVAQLVHFGKLQGLTPLQDVQLALCLEGRRRDLTCDAVGDAYVSAGGELPVHVLLLAGNVVRCSILRIEPAAHRVDLEGAPAPSD